MSQHDFPVGVDFMAMQQDIGDVAQEEADDRRRRMGVLR